MFVSVSGFEMFKEGDTYEGMFLDDKYHGNGVFKFSNGTRYEGEFANGRFEGTGTFYE